MGKAFGGVYANWSGKVGNVVARQYQGRTVLAIYQPNVTNPRTTEQVAVRTKFAALAQFFARVAGFLRVGFKSLDGYKTGNPYSSALGYNSKITGIWDATNEEIDYTKAILSVGSVDIPYFPSATNDSNVVSITWSDNSGMGNALATDEVMVVAYNKDRNASIYNTALANRTERNAEFTLPTSWRGDAVNIWMAMYRPSDGSCSQSEHLATLSL